jgi:hypothetical protein
LGAFTELSAPVTMQHMRSDRSGGRWERLSRAVAHSAASAVIMAETMSLTEHEDCVRAQIAYR